MAKNELAENVPDDLSRLPSLEEDKVQFALSQRFDQHKIYTHINALLVAINPYQLLPIYAQDTLEAYNKYGQETPGPHVFGVAAATYRGLLDARSQSIIISGESGAGKTEVRHVLARLLSAIPSDRGEMSCTFTSALHRLLYMCRVRRPQSDFYSISHTLLHKARALPTRCAKYLC